MKYILSFIILLLSGAVYANEQPPQNGSLHIGQNLNKVQHFLSIEHRDSALYYLNKTLTCSEKIKDAGTLYDAYVRIGQIFLQTGNHSTALVYYFKAIDLLDENKMALPATIRKEKYIYLYAEIAQCFSVTDPQKGISYYQKSLKLLDDIIKQDKTHHHTTQEFILNNNLGTLYLEKQLYDSAEIYYNKSMSFARIAKDSVHYATLYNNLAITSFEKGLKEKSLTLFKKAATLNLLLKDTIQLANVYLNIGEYYFHQKDWEKSLLYCEKSQDLLRKKSSPVIKYKTMQLKTMVYENTQDYRKAYDCMKQADIMKDSLKGSEKIKTALTLEMQYNYDKYKKESELLIQKQRQQTFIYLLIAAVLIIGLLLLHFIQRNHYNEAQKKIMEQDLLRLKAENLELENERLKKDLEFKEKEVNLHAQYLLKKKDVISDTLQQVEESKKEGKVIEEILTEVKKNIEITTMNELEILLQSIHESFYENLYRKHPTLTANERRLCTFIRLNLSSKDISAITGLQVKSVEMARSRLRSKLGLKREENLSIYLQEF